MAILYVEPSRGISLTVDGWSSVSLDVTVGIWNDTWTYSTDPDTCANALGTLEYWLNDGGRPWSGSATFDVTYDYSGEPRLVYMAECSMSCTWAPNAALQTLFDWPSSGQTATAIYSTTGVPTDIAAEVDVTNYVRKQQDSGRFARDGAYCTTMQMTAARIPEGEMLTDEAGAAWFTTALSLSSSPRQMWITAQARSTAFFLYLGRVERQRASGMLYRYTLELMA